jgi:hypothetical protein
MAYPKTRTFVVSKGFRRYNRVVYMCGGVYTVLDALEGMGDLFEAGATFSVKLRIKEMGYYEIVDDPEKRFMFHELDVLVKEELLTEKTRPSRSKKKQT